jgi:NitT/TauT family transport system ATP-binding protein
VAEKREGGGSIPQLAQRLQLEVDDLLPLLDAAVLLGIVELAEGGVRLTPLGRDFATTILRSKDLFRQQDLGRIPVLSSTVHTLNEKENRAMRSDVFLGIWDDDFPLEEAERQLATAVDWGRYVERVEYDTIEGRFHLPG